MTDSGSIKLGRFLLAAFSCLALISSAIQFAQASSANIPAGDVHFERRSASAGSKLSWQWNVSSTVVFSVARTQDPGSLLYSREGTEDSSSVTIPFDDTYVLLWYNPGNITVTLTYSSTVEAGTGSTVLLVAVVSITATLILLLFLGMRSRNRHKGGESKNQDGQRKSPKAEMHSVAPQPPRPQFLPAQPPPPPPPVQVPFPPLGKIFCRQCGRPSPQEAAFCESCGYPLG